NAPSHIPPAPSLPPPVHRRVCTPCPCPQRPARQPRCALFYCCSLPSFSRRYLPLAAASHRVAWPCARLSLGCRPASPLRTFASPLPTTLHIALLSAPS